MSVRAVKWRIIEKGSEIANEKTAKYCGSGSMTPINVVIAIVHMPTRTVPRKSVTYCFQHGIFSWSAAS
jgi:hypothetical protein